MDDETIIPPGILGTRKLAAAFAVVMLRKRGASNKYVPWSDKARRPWMTTELKHARNLRVSGLTYSEIGAALKRTKGAVYAAIGRGAE